ncbi:MAG TPA: hypothetical protein DIU06_03415 [Rhodospirillaceae bacterium]|nr:hypothetical protein [Rhodospirillaceae bacterium]|tara:strand:- start:44537 stop:44968 length:432 start_codon:yes stop_codon:yes gene_type:complete
MTAQHIVMNFATPPSIEDLQVIAHEIIETLPDELLEYTDKLVLEIEEFPDEATEQEHNIEDPFEMLLLFKNGKELYPGVERKHSNEEDILILFRRPILDMWCESCDDLFGLIRQVMIEELGRVHEFHDQDISDMIGRHYQRLL